MTQFLPPVWVTCEKLNETVINLLEEIDDVLNIPWKLTIFHIISTNFNKIIVILINVILTLTCNTATWGWGFSTFTHSILDLSYTTFTRCLSFLTLLMRKTSNLFRDLLAIFYLYYHSLENLALSHFTLSFFAISFSHCVKANCVTY